MNNQDNFYLWLASNASMDTYPNNKTGEFKNKLAVPLTLVENDEIQWEVALAEIFYPNNYHLHIEGVVQFYIEYPRGSQIQSFNFRSLNPRPVRFIRSPLTGPATLSSGETDDGSIGDGDEERPVDQTDGNNQETTNEGSVSQLFNLKFEAPMTFHNIFEFVFKFNKYLDSQGYPWLRFNRLPNGYLSITGYSNAKLTLGNKEAQSFFHKLGFTQLRYETDDEDEFKFFDLPIRADQIPFRNDNSQALFIYSDIIEYQYVGDTRAPLLLAVPIFQPDDVSFVWQAFNRLTYVPVRIGYINEIEISFRNDQGERIRFKEGKSLLKLHFRKRNRVSGLVGI